MSKIIYLLIFGLSLLLFYWYFLKPKKAKEVHYLIHKDKRQVLDISNAYDLYEDSKTLLVAHFGDTHFRSGHGPKKLNPLIRSTIAREPDIIVFTGDLIANYESWPHHLTPILVDKLKRLKAPSGKFAVLGNQDYVKDGQYFVREVLKDAEFQPLINESIFTAKEETAVHIVGMDDTILGHPVYEFDKKIANWQLLLVHEAGHIEKVKSLLDFDLVLTGHQFKKRIFKKNQNAPKFTDGLYQLGSKTLLSIFPKYEAGKIFLKTPTIYYYHLVKESNKKPTS